MRVSLLISLIVHLLVISALLFLFRVVPEMRLPTTIYSVKILQPIVGAKQQAGAEKTEVETKKDEVKKEAVKQPVPARPKKEDAKKKEDTKKTQEVTENKPIDVSIEQGLGDGTGIAVDAPRFPFSYYLEAIERKVSQNWFSAVSAGSDGTSCIVYFQLQRNGGVSNVRIEKGSGNQYFDRAAVRAVKGSSPFPPLPRAFSEPYLGIHFTFLQKDR